MSLQRRLTLGMLWFFLWTTILMSPASALLCTSNEDCRTRYNGEDSTCLSSGECSNPFASGCLRAMEQVGELSNGHTSKRVCNSDDKEDSDYCEEPLHDYMEIVVHNANWESALFYAWIAQIFLMEFLEVPVRVGMSQLDSAATSFYNVDNRVEYSLEAYSWQGIETANDIGDCALVDSPDQQCVHVLPEVWNGQERKWKSHLAKGIIDPVDGNGQVGKIGWYIPVFTAQQFPHFIIFHGLTNNRKQLAEIFERPTTWLDYCEQVSDTNCTSSDTVAERHPATLEEQDLYFADGLFTGHFRPTDQNNCTLHPDACTGHIVAPPCEWDTDVEAQTYWNDIALESGGKMAPNNGYSYGEMVQIWRAAQATQSHVIMWWWKPELHVEEFRGGAAEFQPVILPEATVECRNSRIHPDERCHENIKVRQGIEEGSCDNEAHPLKKIMASSLRDVTYATPEVDRSPAYLALKNLKVGDLEMNSMFRDWVKRGTTGYAAREVVCEYIVDHEQELLEMIPLGYPRHVEEENGWGDIYLKIARAVGGFAGFYLLGAAAAVYTLRSSKVFVYAQVHFVMMVIVGWFGVAVASILYTLEPHMATCSLQNWFRMLGYTMELVPLLVKVSAVNRLMEASKKMKRVKMDPRNLYIRVAMWLGMVAIFLCIYQVVDAPTPSENRKFVEDMDTGEGVIVTTVGCASDSDAWQMVILSFEGFLIVCATVMAFQSRNLQSEFNESKSLAFMTYSHFVFAVLRSIVFVLFRDEFDPANVAGTNSFLLSLDITFSATIYLMPKMARAIYGNDKSSIRASRQSAAVMDIEAKAAMAAARNSGYRDSRMSTGITPPASPLPVLPERRKPRLRFSDTLNAASLAPESESEPTPSSLAVENENTNLTSSKDPVKNENTKEVPRHESKRQLRQASKEFSSKRDVNEVAPPRQLSSFRSGLLQKSLSIVSNPMDTLQRIVSSAWIEDGVEIEFMPSTTEFSGPMDTTDQEAASIGDPEDTDDDSCGAAPPLMNRQVSDGNAPAKQPVRVDSILKTSSRRQSSLSPKRGSQISASRLMPEILEETSGSMSMDASGSSRVLASVPDLEASSPRPASPERRKPMERASLNDLPSRQVGGFPSPGRPIRGSTSAKRPSRQFSDGNPQLQVPRRNTHS